MPLAFPPVLLHFFLGSSVRNYFLERFYQSPHLVNYDIATQVTMSPYRSRCFLGTVDPYHRYPVIRRDRPKAPAWLLKGHVDPYSPGVRTRSLSITRRSQYQARAFPHIETKMERVKPCLPIAALCLLERSYGLNHNVHEL